MSATANRKLDKSLIHNVTLENYLASGMSCSEAVRKIIDDSASYAMVYERTHAFHFRGNYNRKMRSALKLITRGTFCCNHNDFLFLVPTSS